LEERQVAILASVVKQEWFDIIQKMMEQEVKLLNVRLINTETSNPQEILAQPRDCQRRGDVLHRIHPTSPTDFD
jgi:hypothetical protein